MQLIEYNFKIVLIIRCLYVIVVHFNLQFYCRFDQFLLKLFVYHVTSYIIRIYANGG